MALMSEVAELGEQARALTGAVSEESECEGPAHLGQRSPSVRTVGAAVLGATLLAALAFLASGDSSALPWRSAYRPGAALGLSEEAGQSKACKKVYIDTDVGIDDNIALISAFGQHRKGTICIIGIGVTDGNIPAWISQYTFPRLLALFGMEDIPFSTPAVEEGKSGDIKLLFNDTDGDYLPEGGRGSAEHIHGKGGMGGLAEFLSLDPDATFPNKDPEGNPGAFLEQRLKKECGVKDCDLLVLGPLTNIVAAPKDVLAEHVDRTIWMGGSFVNPEEKSKQDMKGINYVPLTRGDWNVGLRRRGNIAPLSEFNAWAGSEPLAQFLTERDESVGFDMIPLDVTSKLMWSPSLIDRFEEAADAADDSAWDCKKFRDQLMKFRSQNPGTSKEHNEALGEQINKAFREEMAARRKSNFSYPATPSGRAAFVRDISVKGWASTVIDGQIPQKAVANLAHDVAVLVYELRGDLFEPGEEEDVSVVVKGTATDQLWSKLEDDDFMGKQYKNEQWGVEGAPIKDDLKGAVFEPSEAADAQVMQDFAEKGLTKNLQIKTGTARVVQFAQFPGEPGKAETQVMEWLADALAQATGNL